MVEAKHCMRTTVLEAKTSSSQEINDRSCSLEKGGIYVTM